MFAPSPVAEVFGYTRNMGGFSCNLCWVYYYAAGHYTNHRKIWWKSRLTLSLAALGFIMFAVCFLLASLTFEPGMDFAPQLLATILARFRCSVLYAINHDDFIGITSGKWPRHPVYLIFKNLSGCNWRIINDNHLDTKESLHP